MLELVILGTSNAVSFLPDHVSLIHYPTDAYAARDLIAEARKSFQGEVDLATDFMTVAL